MENLGGAFFFPGLPPLVVDNQDDESVRGGLLSITSLIGWRGEERRGGVGGAGGSCNVSEFS